MRHVNPIAVLVGLVVIFVGLIVLRAAFRQFGEGNPLAGCCMWELADSIIDLGCGLIGCATAATAVLALVAWLGWPHH
jgi:hypothetical protein